MFQASKLTFTHSCLIIYKHLCDKGTEIFLNAYHKLNTICRNSSVFKLCDYEPLDHG